MHVHQPLTGALHPGSRKINMLRKRSRHIPDSRILLMQTAELSARGARRAQAHLDACDQCSAQAMRLAAAMREVAGFEASRAEAASVPIVHIATNVARVKLIAAVQQSKLEASSSPRRMRIAFRRLAFPGLAVCLLLVAARFVPNMDGSAGTLLRTWKGASLPSRTLTPGATHLVALDDLCSIQGSTARVPIDDAVAKKVFQEYGLSFSSRSSYEVDYLITPGLGGSSDVRNLWPEPESTSGWNAQVKDALEDHLHDLVCQGKLPLATAQSEIAGDWIAAYKKHFHTDKPLRS
jgi:hypothetical protein